MCPVTSSDLKHQHGLPTQDSSDYTSTDIRRTTDHDILKAQRQGYSPAPTSPPQHQNGHDYSISSLNGSEESHSTPQHLGRTSPVNGDQHCFGKKQQQLSPVEEFSLCSSPSNTSVTISIAAGAGSKGIKSLAPLDVSAAASGLHRGPNVSAAVEEDKETGDDDAPVDPLSPSMLTHLMSR